MKDFMLSLSAVSVIMSAAWLLLPEGRMEKSMKYALGIFALAGIICAFGKISLSLPGLETKFSSAQISYNIETAAAETAIEEVLEKSNIPVKKVTAVTDISGSDSINITKVVLELENNKDFYRAAELIRLETGLESECG